MKREFRAWRLVVSLGLVLGCELGRSVDGGPGPGPDTEVTLGSTASLDGFVRTDGNAQTTNGLTGDISVVSNQGFRQFYTFDLSAVPPGSTITSATLHLYQSFLTGNPYGKLGSVVVDHVIYGDTLCCADFNAAALASAGTLSTSGNLEWKQLTVTAPVQGDLASSRTRSQFRLRFTNVDFTNDGVSDNVVFNEAESINNNPQLVVKYQPPPTP